MITAESWPPIDFVGKVRLTEADTLVLRMDADLDPERAGYLADLARAVFRHEHVAVLGRGVSLDVVAREEES